MEFGAIIKELGGGPASVSIAVLGWVAWQMFKYYVEASAARLSDTKENSKEMAELIRDNTNKMETLTRLIEAKFNVR